MTNRLTFLSLFLLAGGGTLASPLAYAQSCGCPPAVAGVPAAEPGVPVVVAPEPPPPLPEEEQPPLPAPGYLWTPGYWYWNNVDYYYVPGAWVAPPRPGLLWTPGFWVFAAGVYRFSQGYWGPRVGFYGGIPYGNGYDGRGYDGGRWTNNQFFYNRSVTNITDTHITQIYEHPVAIDQRGPRISFNGGPNGIALRPDEAQLALLREPRVVPTEGQLRHVRAAAMTPAAFDAVNNGRPSMPVLLRSVHDQAEHLPEARPPGPRPDFRPEPGPGPRPGDGRADPSRAPGGPGGPGAPGGTERRPGPPAVPDAAQHPGPHGDAHPGGMPGPGDRDHGAPIQPAPHDDRANQFQAGHHPVGGPIHAIGEPERANPPPHGREEGPPGRGMDAARPERAAPYPMTGGHPPPGEPRPERFGPEGPRPQFRSEPPPHAGAQPRPGAPPHEGPPREAPHGHDHGDPRRPPS
ncbi:hypothetical protein [Rhizosaccharibacter radicis]|uniref:YXWGXW repeat-containing protein n=1 Tax=Rhizosaccharibacter radicis TaxID=2782605 RepID=UPI003BF4712B